MNDGTVVERRVESARSSPKHSPAPASQVQEAAANITEEFEVKLQIQEEIQSDEAKAIETYREEGEGNNDARNIQQLAVDRSMDGEEVEHIPSPEHLNEEAAEQLIYH